MSFTKAIKTPDGDTIHVVGDADVGTFSEEANGTVTGPLPYEHEQDGRTQMVRLGFAPSPTDLDAGELGAIVAEFEFYVEAHRYEPDHAVLRASKLLVGREEVSFSPDHLRERLEAVADAVAEACFDQSAWFDALSKDWTREQWRRYEWDEAVD